MVRDAQHLVELAQAEAARIVSDAREETTRRVEDLLKQAEELREVAQAELVDANEEAEQVRREARSEADRLLAHARSTHDQVVKSALEVEKADTGGASLSADLNDARKKADKILRVARAEAEARSAEIIEQAGRRAENAERNARAKVEALKGEYREMQRNMREEEIAVKARIADLEYQAGAKPGSAKHTDESPAEPRETGPATRSEPESRPDEPAQSEEADQSAVARPVRSAASAAQQSIRVRLAEGTEDPDVLKALKAFRRRT